MNNMRENTGFEGLYEDLCREVDNVALPGKDDLLDIIRAHEAKKTSAIVPSETLSAHRRLSPFARFAVAAAVAATVGTVVWFSLSTGGNGGQPVVVAGTLSDSAEVVNDSAVIESPEPLELDNAIVAQKVKPLDVATPLEMAKVQSADTVASATTPYCGMETSVVTVDMLVDQSAASSASEEVPDTSADVSPSSQDGMENDSFDAKPFQQVEEVSYPDKPTVNDVERKTRSRHSQRAIKAKHDNRQNKTHNAVLDKLKYRIDNRQKQSLYQSHNTNCVPAYDNGLQIILY